MKAIFKWLIGGGIAVGATAGILALTGFKKDGDSLQTIPDIAIDAVGITWVRFRIIPLIKNPSSTTFKFDFPFISIYHGDNLLGSTNLPATNAAGNAPTITLKGRSQVSLAPPVLERHLKIRVESDRLGGLLPILSNWLISGEKPKPEQVTLRIVTQTNLLIGKQGEEKKIPLKMVENISLV